MAILTSKVNTIFYLPTMFMCGNLDNKANRSILGIVMSKDGRICFIVVPDKNIMIW